MAFLPYLYFGVCRDRFRTPWQVSAEAEETSQ